MEIRIFTRRTSRIIDWLYADYDKRLNMVLGFIALASGFMAVCAVAWMMTA